MCSRRNLRHFLLSLLIVLFLQAVLDAAVTLDGTAGSANTGQGVTSMTVDIAAVGNNTNRALILLIDAGDTTHGAVSSVSGAGATWGLCATGGSSNGNGATKGTCYVGKAPTVNASPQTITITFAGTTDSSMTAIVYSVYNVDQTTPTSNYGAATSGDLAISTTTGDLTISSMFDSSNTRSVTGCTTTLDVNAFGNNGYMSAHCTNASSTTYTWSGFSANTSIAIGVNVKQVTASTGAPGSLMTMGVGR